MGHGHLWAQALDEETHVEVTDTSRKGTCDQYSEWYIYQAYAVKGISPEP